MHSNSLNFYDFALKDPFFSTFGPIPIKPFVSNVTVNFNEKMQEKNKLKIYNYFFFPYTKFSQKSDTDLKKFHNKLTKIPINPKFISF